MSPRIDRSALSPLKDSFLGRLLLPGDERPMSDAAEIRSRLEKQVDLVIDGGPCGTEPSTVIDLTEEIPRVLREGKGSLAPFAVERV